MPYPVIVYIVAKKFDYEQKQKPVMCFIQIASQMVCAQSLEPFTHMNSIVCQGWS